MTKLQQVDREKFVVRFDDHETRHLIQGEANATHTSMNGWILQAIDEKLARGVRIDRLLDAAENALTK
jgi:uncharacterized protein (DUF1778 family)